MNWSVFLSAILGSLVVLAGYSAWEKMKWRQAKHTVEQMVDYGLDRVGSGFGEIMTKMTEVKKLIDDTVAFERHDGRIYNVTQETLAQAIADSYWRMQGGTGYSPSKPSAGDYQLAYDIIHIGATPRETDNAFFNKGFKDKR